MKKGDILLLPFPFADLTGSKIRPALVLVHNHQLGSLDAAQLKEVDQRLLEVFDIQI